MYPPGRTGRRRGTDGSNRHCATQTAALATAQSGDRVRRRCCRGWRSKTPLTRVAALAIFLPIIAGQGWQRRDCRVTTLAVEPWRWASSTVTSLASCCRAR